MTPAIVYLKQQKIAHQVHEYHLSKPSNNYGQDVADELGVPHARVYKTLMVSLDGDPRKLGVCIVPVAGSLNLKAAAKAHKAKKAQMADPKIAEKISGYIVGGISPFGQKKRLPTVLDASAMSFETIFTSGGKRTLEIEFAPQALLDALRATTADLAD
jgi:Cys-tRNA(Pro)/Cys-tRNA(Cys) deacylase